MAVTIDKLVFFNQFKGALGKRILDARFEHDQLFLYLSNDVPDVIDHSVPEDVPELAETNGYEKFELHDRDYIEDPDSPGNWRLETSEAPAWNATGGVIGPFKYIVLMGRLSTEPERYEVTLPSDAVVPDTDPEMVASLKVSGSSEYLIGYFELSETKTIDPDDEDGGSFAIELEDGLIFKVYDTLAGRVRLFSGFKSRIASGQIAFKSNDEDANNDTIYAYLTNNTPDRVEHFLVDDLGEIAQANGYDGPREFDHLWEPMDNGFRKWALVIKDFLATTWTATGGDIPAWRYMVFFVRTNGDAGPDPTIDLLLGYFDKGSSSVTAEDDQAIVQFSKFKGDNVLMVFTHAQV